MDRKYPSQTLLQLAYFVVVHKAIFSLIAATAIFNLHLPSTLASNTAAVLLAAVFLPGQHSFKISCLVNTTWNWGCKWLAGQRSIPLSTWSLSHWCNRVRISVALFKSDGIPLLASFHRITCWILAFTFCTSSLDCVGFKTVVELTTGNTSCVAGILAFVWSFPGLYWTTHNSYYCKDMIHLAILGGGSFILFSHFSGWWSVTSVNLWPSMSKNVSQTTQQPIPLSQW